MKTLLSQPRSPRREPRGGLTSKVALAVVAVIFAAFAANTFLTGPVSTKGGTVGTPRGMYARGFVLTDIDGNRMPFADLAGKVTLIVNVASLCGFTKVNYEQLAKLHASYATAGLVILGFPCNQFGNQEPGTNSEIKSFAQSRGALFPMMNKIMVNGPQTNDLWAALKMETAVPEIRWNFEKFLIDRSGRVVAHHASNEPPSSFEAEIANALE